MDEAQAGIKIAGRNISIFRYADDTILMVESKEELKSLLMKVKEESEKVGESSTFRKIRSWHLVPSLQVTDFIFLGSKSLQIAISAMKLKDTCSLEEKL